MLMFILGRFENCVFIYAQRCSAYFFGGICMAAVIQTVFMREETDVGMRRAQSDELVFLVTF